MIIHQVILIALGLYRGTTADACQPANNLTAYEYTKSHEINVTVYRFNTKPSLSRTTTCDSCNEYNMTSFSATADIIEDVIQLPRINTTYSGGRYVGNGKMYVWDTTVDPPIDDDFCSNLLLIDTSAFSKCHHRDENGNEYFVFANDDINYTMRTKTKKTSCGRIFWLFKHSRIVISDGKIEEGVKDQLPEKAQAFFENHRGTHKNLIRMCLSSEGDDVSKLKGDLAFIFYAVAAILCYLGIHFAILTYTLLANTVTFNNCKGLLQANVNRILHRDMREPEEDKQNELYATAQKSYGGDNKARSFKNTNAESTPNEYQDISSDYEINDLYTSASRRN